MRTVAAFAACFAAHFLFADSQTFNATKDVNAKFKFADTNFGADPTLQVSNQSGFQKIIYVQFTVANIPAGATNITAQLKLRSQTTGTGRSITAHAVTNTSWGELTLTWNNKPALGTSLSTVSSHTATQDSVWDVTGHVTGNGTFAIGLDTTFTSGDTTFDSKEGGTAPRVVVTYTPPAVTPTVSFNATDFNASEAALDPATIQVVSSAPAPTGGLVVKYSISGTAQANDNANGAPDYILSPANNGPTSGTITIAQGQTTATLTLTPIQDTLFEGKESAIFTLTSDPAYTVGTPRVAQVIIADNETAPFPNPDHTATDEGGWIVQLTGTLPNGECSGMVTSRLYPGVHWYHRDATTNTGDPRSRLYAIELSNATNNGTVIKTIDITAPAGWSDVWGNDPSHQWEDAAEDPDVPGVIWIGDIGNNNGRNVIRLFKVNEPSPYGGVTSVQATAGYYLKYPTGVSVNCECLFIFEGIPHVIVKESGSPRIYRAPSTTLSTNQASPTLMELVGNVFSGGSSHSVSSFSADRKRMVLATHGAMWVYVSQSALDPVNNQLTPAQALTYIQDLLCTRAPVWSLKHNGGQQDPEAQLGSVEGGSFVGDGYDVLFGAEGKQVIFLPAWWYETQPAPFPVPPAAPTVNNTAPDCFLFKPIDGATFSKTAGSITLQACASDYDGTISNIKFYQKLGSGSRVLIGTGTATGGYHQITWTISGVATGSYTVSADATDNAGAVTTDSVTITINP